MAVAFTGRRHDAHPLDGGSPRTSRCIESITMRAIVLLTSFVALGLACSGSAESGASHAELVVSNDTGHAIEYLYYRACGETAYDATKLGSVTIRAGMTYSLRVLAGCYDVAVVTDEASGALEAEARSRDVTARGASIAFTREELAKARVFPASPGCQPPTRQAPEGGPRAASTQELNLVRSFGDGSLDAAFDEEVEIQRRFFSAPAEVLRFNEGSDAQANANAYPSGAIAFGF